MKKAFGFFSCAVAAIFAVNGAATADTFSVDANLENWGASDSDPITPTLVFSHTFALPAILSIDAVSFDFAHSFLSDVRLTLEAPNGDIFVLAVGDGPTGSPFQAGGDSSDLGNGGSLLAGTANYRFIQAGGSVFNNGLGDPAPGGNYNAVTWFAGDYAAGDWTVEVLDVWDNLDDGALGTVAVEYTVPAPGALALLGVAGLAARRRRRSA